ASFGNPSFIAPTHKPTHKTPARAAETHPAAFPARPCDKLPARPTFLSSPLPHQKYVVYVGRGAPHHRHRKSATPGMLAQQPPSRGRLPTPVIPPGAPRDKSSSRCPVRKASSPVRENAAIRRNHKKLRASSQKPPPPPQPRCATQLLPTAARSLRPSILP